MLRISLFLAASLAAQGAQAQMSAQQRANLLSFYPCGKVLNDDRLAYLDDWANATRQDPCQLTAQEFTSYFGDNAAPANGSAQAPIDDVKRYFEDQRPADLFVIQVLILGRDSADGVWGPMTAGRLGELLNTYHAIGGIDDEWGVRNTADVPRFLKWVAAAEFAQAMGGEFPD